MPVLLSMNTREKHPFVLILAFYLSRVVSQATPVISVPPLSQTVAVGTTARFTVEALSNLPMTYEWRWLTNGTRGTNILGATDPTLSLENAMISGARFVAVVSDSQGSVTIQVVRLTVIYPPGLVDPPLTQFAWAGQPVALKVLTTNTSVLKYQWLLNGTSLPKGSNATYSIARAHATNEGDYQVILTNLAGSLTSRVAHLTVRSMPPPTGASFVNLTNLERGLLAVLQQHAVPAASLAIMKDGRLMAARGYGFIDADTGELTQPDSLFRIGSLSKAITATAMLRLVEQGNLSLEDKVFPLLNLPPPTFPGAKVDPRLNHITIRNLLNHTSGWDRYAAFNPEGTVGFDPTWWLERCSADLGISRVPTARELLGWITGFPLQSDPGAAFAYSNNGYVTCRVIIEQVTGQRYVDYIRSMLAPVGITRMSIQGTTREERLPDEVVQWFSPAFQIREVGYWQTPPSAERGQPVATWVTAGGKRTFALTFRRLLLAHELKYSVEASGDLIHWAELSETAGVPVLNADGTQTVVIPDVLTADEQSHRFLRLKVVRVRVEQ